MAEPVGGCRPHLPVRAEQITADWVVHLAAERAKVDRECEPVSAFGPSFEQLRLEQQAAVGSPVATLIRSVRGMSTAEVFAAVSQISSLRSSWLSRVAAVEKLMLSFVSLAKAEGDELRLARIRDAKTTVFLALAEPLLPQSFYRAAVDARRAGRGEAGAILRNIDGVPGLRETLTRDVRLAVAEGRQVAAARALAGPAELAALLERALAAKAVAAQLRSPADADVVTFAARFEGDTAFRIGVYAALFDARR